MQARQPLFADSTTWMFSTYVYDSFHSTTHRQTSSPRNEKHIYGEGVTDVFKTIGRKLFGKTVKEAAKTATKKALQTAATTTGEYAGEKAGDKIIQLLSKKNKNTKTPVAASRKENPQTRELSDYEINERVNQLLSGGRMRKFI